MSQYTFEGKKRKRARKVRSNSIFKNAEDMLVFILYDYRHNPTQDFMGLHFNLPQPKGAMWIKVLDPLLIGSLRQLKLVPKRESDSLDDRLIGSVTMLWDGSERPITDLSMNKKNIIAKKKEAHDKKQPDNKHEWRDFIFKPDLCGKCTRQKDMRQGRTYFFQKTTGDY